MKNIFKLVILLFILLNYNYKGLQMVESPNDVYKLKTNEQQFINKPLKKLLKEIKPEIKMAWATSDLPNYFSFRFIDPEEVGKIGIKNISLFVYVKEQINWQSDKRPKEKKFVWTKKDAEKYGNLTVIRINNLS